MVFTFNSHGIALPPSAKAHKGLEAAMPSPIAASFMSSDIPALPAAQPFKPFEVSQCP